MNILRLLHGSFQLGGKSSRTTCPNVRWLHQSTRAIDILVYPALNTCHANPTGSKFS